MPENRTPNLLLAAVIDEVGITYHALACEIRAVAAEAGQRLGTAPSTISAWVAGAAPAGRTALYIAEALSRKARRTVTPTEIGLRRAGTGEIMAANPLVTAAEYGRAVLLRRREFLDSAFTHAAAALPVAYDHEAAARTLAAVRTQGRVGAGEVTAVRQLTEHFRTVDDRLGGGHGLTTVTAYLTDTVNPMLRARFPSETLRRDAFAAAAQLACLTGWKLHDLGRDGASQKFYHLAYQLACEADPHGLAAWMMRALTHQALDLNQPGSSAELAEEAGRRASGHVDRQTEALLLVTCARAHGTAGETGRAARALLAAEDAAADTRDPVSPYAAGSGPVAATVASHTAKTLTAMNDHPAAERHYRTALAGRAPGRYQRGHGLTLINLGRSVAAQHRYEESVTLWGRALDVMDGVISHRGRQEIKTIRSAAAGYQQRGVTGAGHLRRQATVLLRATA
ncbi:tetratricopeptide repeat protein [Streptomyces uncialis]|uniref:tetratricopeptide repeat protein n=1 Tax=Streptomyces uncialis TaxID=1048205 RepID=UPI00386CB47D|nr:tetratricopeptide repeat protein [Streptomyces uncialis]